MAELAHAHVEAQPRFMGLEVARQRIGVVRGAFGHHHQRMGLAALGRRSGPRRPRPRAPAPFGHADRIRRRRRCRPSPPGSRSRGPSPRPGSRGRCDEAVTRSRSTDSSATSMAVVAPMVMSEPSRSLSMVEATPTTARPLLDSACAPHCEPLPPMTTSAPMSCCGQRAQRLVLAGIGPQFGATRGAERGAAQRQDATHFARAEGDELAGDQAGVAVANAKDLEAARQRTARHAADRRVHARGVAAAGQHCESLHVDCPPPTAAAKSRRC